MKSYKTKYLSILSAVVGIISFVFPINAEEWRLHPSFDRTPLRIIDTPKDTYFLVHQQVYDKGKNGYDFPSLTLFRYDKNTSDKGITPLVHDVPLSSADIRLADYSPKGDFLIVVYNDGGIDLIDKNKHLTHIDKLKRYTIPGMAKVTSVSFEPSTGDAWIGTDAGYMHVDAGTFAIEDVKVFDCGIDRICRFRDKLVAISGNAAWQSDVVNPLTFNEFKKISAVNSPSLMLPLADNEFAFVNGTPGTTRALMLAKFDGTNWSVLNLGSDNFYSIADANTLVNRYEANFIPNRDGYIIFSTSKAWQLYAPKNGEATKFVSVSLDANPISLGSWDFSNFWNYRDRGTFVSRHADFTLASNATSAKASWSDIQSPIRPNAPAAFICTYMDYSPKYGMLVINHGHEAIFSNNTPMLSALLSKFIDNHWEVFSQVYNPPTSIETNANLKTLYNNYKERFPVADPNGLLIDSSNEDWICCGSMFGGIMFQDLRDIKKDVIRFGASNDLFKEFPRFVPHTETPTWGTLSCFSPPTMDRNGTIWAIYSNAFTPTASESSLHIKFMKKGDRERMYSLSDSELKTTNLWNTIVMPYKDLVFWSCKIKALRHAKNNNKIVICPALVSSPVIIYDHKGTLDDISDDEFEEIYYMDYRNLESIKFLNFIDVEEDPLTGNIYINLYNRTIVMDPINPVINNKIYGEYIQDKIEGDNLPSNIQINKILFDEFGYLWLATNNQGLIKISQDRKKIISRFNTKNSPLPSDCIYGLGWNPEKKSLIASTKLGLIELLTDIESNIEIKETFVVEPQVVTPQYNGNVVLKNLLPMDKIRILDDKYNLVKCLENNQLRNIEWDLKNSKGTRVAPGIYNIESKNNNRQQIIVMSE